INSRQDEINYILKELLEKLQEIQLYGGLELQSSKDSQSKTPSSTGGTSQSERSLPKTPEKVDPEKLYETAKQELEQDNYTLAESRFIAFLLQFPTHSLAPNAQYWLGEAAYAQEDYEQAVAEFGKVVKKYPKSPKLRAALLKIGYSQIEMNDIKSAKKTLQEITRKHKNSEEAQLAREKLNEIE
ncbi:tol-pal system protein YbgF, partial [Candidatus Omnitrophota bacterium]